ncbi:YdeI/OmpD-associated family protein [Sanyastnella coralliicola]|uniref:YdeI/OmpD-associated family protein n=1 Tax=Sanyastnella coralliicola TaxID=3069118 RepID=UPI0027B8E0F7|nr:YdeI/OmpD-associated family protein [Longitalea sp. SCSIO 12813]
MAGIKTENFIQVECTSQEALRNWLLEHHQQEEAIWLVTYKKQEIEKYVSREEVLDELIAFGWIDGIRRKLDETKTMQLISPRRKQHWAKSYKERAARLIEVGSMHESGMQSIQRSKADGLWNFMDDVDNLVVPDDLRKALQTYDTAEAFFEQINDSSKRFVLRWVKLAKTDKTRQKRIQELALLSSRGEKLKGS